MSLILCINTVNPQKLFLNNVCMIETKSSENGKRKQEPLTFYQTDGRKIEQSSHVAGGILSLKTTDISSICYIKVDWSRRKTTMEQGKKMGKGTAHVQIHTITQFILKIRPAIAEKKYRCYHHHFLLCVCVGCFYITHKSLLSLLHSFSLLFSVCCCLSLSVGKPEGFSLCLPLFLFAVYSLLSLSFPPTHILPHSVLPLRHFFHFEQYCYCSTILDRKYSPFFKNIIS